MGDKVHERRWWILAVLCLSLIIVVDNSILNVALPTLARPESQGGAGCDHQSAPMDGRPYTLVVSACC